MSANEIAHLHVKIDTVIDTMGTILNAIKAANVTTRCNVEDQVDVWSMLPVLTENNLLTLEEWLKEKINYNAFVSITENTGTNV